MDAKTKTQFSELGEYLEVVDQDNRIISQASRRQIHQQELYHRSAHILISNPPGEIFLQKRSDNKDEFPGYWDSSAAGHVDVGESYEDCIVRELYEELGISLVEAPQYQFLMPASVENGWEFCQVFRGQHSGPFQLDATEVAEAAWFTLPELCAWLEEGGQGLTYTLKRILIHLYPELDPS